MVMAEAIIGQGHTRRRVHGFYVNQCNVLNLYVIVILLIQQLTIPQKKHTPDPTAHKRLKETHDLCASLVPVGNTNRD